MTTDIVQISHTIPVASNIGGVGGMKKIKTFTKVINFVMQHADRLILDDYIYMNVNLGESSQLQMI